MKSCHSVGAAHAVDAASLPSAGSTPPSKILRFLPAERFLHWALAGPFVMLYVSAALVFLCYGEPYPRHFRDAFAIAHRVFGVLLIVLPPLALLRGRADRRMHFANMRAGWIWARDDFRWLLLFPKNALNPKVELPEQGKFNAAEKLNFMMVSTFYPLYIVTGIMVWLPGVAIFAYLAHYAMALAGIPLVLGHIFMATVNPDTKVGLSGMITGWVDRNWAKHHYRRWYRENFEDREILPLLSAQLEHPARVRCGECKTEQSFASWDQLIERTFQVEPLVCSACQAPIRLMRTGEDGRPVEAIVRHLLDIGEQTPLEDRNAAVA